MCRPSVAPPGNRNAFGHRNLEQVDVPIGRPLPSHSAPYEQTNTGFAAAKGSRLVKFFDGKGRDARPGMGKAPMGGPAPAQRGELSGYNGMPNGNPDARAMEDIFAMLSNSAHVGFFTFYPSSALISFLGSEASYATRSVGFRCCTFQSSLQSSPPSKLTRPLPTLSRPCPPGFIVRQPS
jgi:hypothetical protein